MVFFFFFVCSLNEGMGVVVFFLFLLVCVLFFLFFGLVGVVVGIFF